MLDAILILKIALAPVLILVASLAGNRWGDIIVRILAAVALILAITEYAPVLGPTLSGLLTPFPIYTSVMVSSIHSRKGTVPASQFIRGATVSLFTPAVFWLMVGSTIVSLGVGASYILAIVASMILHWALLMVLSRRPQLAT